jgi:hypothetical protein
MKTQAAPAASKTLRLTEEEAMALLDVCMMSRVADDPSKRAVVEKVALICREFVREEPDTALETRHRSPDRWGGLLPTSDAAAPSVA